MRKVHQLEKKLAEYEKAEIESKVIDEYILNQQQKINELTQHIMVLETKIRVLENEKNDLTDKLQIVEDINSEYRKTYRRSPFK